MLTHLNAFSEVNAVTWSPDGKSLASVSDDVDEAVMIWGASLDKSMREVAEMVELGEGNSPLLLTCRSNLKIAEMELEDN